MGQKIHPLGFRLGITKKHKSQWFAKTNKYPQLVVEDYFLRKIINAKFYNAGIENILIQRKLDQIKIEICAARAGILIGKQRKNLDLLRFSLEKQLKRYRLRNFNVLSLSNFANFQLTSKLACSKKIFTNTSKLLLQTPNSNQTPVINKKLQIPANINSPKISIHILKLNNPDTKANFIADFLVERLEKRGSFRQAIKTAVRRCQKAKVKGIKIQISGRLNGAEIARTEWVREGRVPLQTLRADIDYSYKTAKTIYGILGIKVWVFNGELNSNNSKISY